MVQPWAVLVSDVVDSTKLTEELGDDRMTTLWIAHDRAARDLLAVHDGREADRTDGFVALFADAAAALAFARAFHAALSELSRTAGVRLVARVGVHWGPVLVLEPSADQRGRGVKPLAIEGETKAHATLVASLAAAEATVITGLVKERLGPSGRAFTSHGWFQARGSQPFELFEDGSPTRSAPAARPDVWPVALVHDLWIPRGADRRLPAEADRFVGREAETAMLGDWLRDGARIVTVVGAGGCGKTRLVRRVAWTLLGEFPGGACLCDLSDARSSEAALHAVATGLDVRLDAADPADQLGHALAARGRSLLVLDNLEQVAGPVGALVQQWCERAPQVAFVDTSRTRLGLAAERVLPLEPLGPNEAVELFEVRARAQVPSFRLDDERRAVVAEIVTALDGLPLAIELAASRVRVLSLPQILAGLADRFRLLAAPKGGARRSATLRAAIDWSWELLAPWEREAVAQLSVFVGGFPLSAAEAVIDLAAFPDAPWALDVVQSLVDQSLLRSDATRDAEPAFVAYASIRAYAEEKLRERSDAARAAVLRHGRHYAALGAPAALEALDGDDGPAMRRTLAAELPNVVEACRRAIGRHDPEILVPTLRAAWAGLRAWGPLALAVDLAEAGLALPDLPGASRAELSMLAGQALATAGRAGRVGELLDGARLAALSEGDARLAAVALGAVGNHLRRTGRRPEAIPVHEQALAELRAIGDARAEGQVLGNLGLLLFELGRSEEAEGRLREALAIAKRSGSRSLESTVLANLGILYAERGSTAEADASLSAGLALHRAFGDRLREATALSNLGNLRVHVGAFAESVALFEASLRITREIGARPHEGNALGSLAMAEAESGEVARARVHYLEALAIHREVGDRRREATVLGNLGVLHAEHGEVEEAEPLLREALGLHRADGSRKAEGNVLVNLAGLCQDRGRSDEARGHLEAALVLGRLTGARGLEAQCYHQLGRIASDAGEFDDAESWFSEAASTYRATGDVPELAMTLLATAELRSRRADPSAAEVLAQAAGYVDRLGVSADSELAREHARVRGLVG